MTDYRDDMDYVAAFRAYAWSDDIEELARRFFRACPSARQVVLADETRGPLPISGYEVVRHTEDTSSLGLPIYPKGSSLWFNVDYGAYILRDALPDYDYYLLSESDLAVNLELEPMVQAAADRQIDIVTHDVRLSDPEWHWHADGAANFDEVWRSLLFFMVLSGRAIDLLADERRRMGVELEAGRLAAWPFCEPFVPSVLKRAGMRFAEVSEFAATEHLNFRPRISLDDPRANQPGSLAHSVLGREAFLKASIAEQPPRDWFFPNTELHRALHAYPPADYVEALGAAFAARLDHAGMSRFGRWLEREGNGLAKDNAGNDLAFCKPALSSSTSKWSHYADPQLDAAGANGAVYHDDAGFHTSEEDGPWWVVDLLDEAVIDQIRIVNRPHFPERFINFLVESSSDGGNWIIRHIKLDAEGVSADRDHPHVIEPAEPFVARFVRIRLLGRGMLHLRRVQLFGRQLQPRHAESVPPRDETQIPA